MMRNTAQYICEICFISDLLKRTLTSWRDRPYDEISSLIPVLASPDIEKVRKTLTALLGDS